MNVTVGIVMDVMRDYPSLDSATQMEIAVYRDRGVSSPALEHIMIATADARRSLMTVKGEQQFVIARMVGLHPQPRFSTVPFIHPQYGEAFKEQKRLARNENDAFGLYQLLHIFCARDAQGA